MSMSSSVSGFRPPDAHYRKMMAAYKACNDAGVAIPREVDDFFNGETPDPAGTEVGLGKAVTEYHDEMQEGFEVDISKLPKGVTIIRFVNSF